MSTRSIFGVIGLTFFSLFANADQFGGRFDVNQTLGQLEYHTKDLDRNVNKVKGSDRRQAKRRVEQLINQLEDIADDLGQNAAGWFQADGQECVSFCRAQGLTSGLSPEGAQCASGENQVDSALGSIVYSYGTWGSPGGPNHVTRSSGGYCYKPGQKADKDRTDITVGCFCER